MISRIHFMNFRSHGDSTLGLKPLSLLIGPVAAGKSNVFKGMLLIQNSVHRSLVELFPPGLGEFHWVRSRWAEETAPIGFDVTIEKLPDFSGQVARYTLKLADSPAGIYVLEETLQRETGDGPAQWVFQRRARSQSLGEFGSVDPYEPTILNRVWHSDSRVKAAAPGARFARAVAQSMSRFGYYHLEAADLKALGTGQPSQRIGYNGERLPDFMAWAKSEAPDVFGAILKQMQELLPGLEDILVTQTQVDRQGIAMAFLGYRGYIAAPDLSDGTLFTLGLLCIGAARQRPEVICIEEPEGGLHPRRLRWLFDRFLELAYPREGLPSQIILSTHSPYIVDLFSEMTDAVQIVEQIDGRTKINSLDEIQTMKLHLDSHGGEPIGQHWARGLYEGL